MNHRQQREQQTITLFQFAQIEDTVEPNYSPGATTEERFWQFHEANPHVYRHLRDRALELKRRGFKRIGIKWLYEVLRWQYAMQTNSGDGFKLNNNYCPYYARILMKQEPELTDFFETRAMKSKSH